MHEFKEPRPNMLATSACKFILPIWLRFKENLAIKIRGQKEDLEAFTRQRRAVVLLNHPDRQDPFVICELAKKMHEDFYCIAARECFDWDGGWRGKLFQSLGCYSVARGKPDFHSIATTEKILREGQRKLVVFPEAEITGDESKIHHLQQAIFHIILDVQKDLDKSSEADKKAPLMIIPAAIKYSLQSDLKSAVTPALQNIEQLLGISAEESAEEKADAHSRVLAIVEAYIGRVISSYGLNLPSGDLANRVEETALNILQTIASTCGSEYDESLYPTERLYAIRNHTVNKGQENSVAIEPRAFHCAGINKPCISSDFERIERLFILQRLLLHTQSEISYCRMLDFIESEVTGKISAKGNQQCTILLGSPMDVSSFVEAYKESKEQGVDALSKHFKQKLQEMVLSI